MTSSHAPVLLIDRGDLPSLTAALIQPDPSRLVLWHRHETGGAGGRRETHARGHAELLGVRDLIVTGTGTDAGVEDGPDAAAGDEPLPMARVLLEAVATASRRGCDRVIWPIQIGLDAARVATAVDCSTLVAEIAEIQTRVEAAKATDAGRPARSTTGLVIDLPLVDLDDEQVVDLADETGAPLDAFWPCDGGAETPCGVCAGCARWSGAFAARGLPGPWEAVTLG